MGRFGLLLTAVFVAAATSAGSGREAPAPLPTGPGCTDADITASANLIGSLRPVGYPIVGFTAGVEGRLLKFHVEFGGALGPCRPPDEVHSLDNFSWSLSGPATPQPSTSELEGEHTLTPSFLLDVEGTYRVRLVPCPAGCTIVTSAGITISVPTQPIITLTIVAVPSAPLAPESVPALPASAQSPTDKHPLALSHCSFDAGFTGSQWFAVEQISGPGDYQRVEGLVESSRVSRKDSPFNHAFQDTNFHVRPDPQFRHVLRDYGPFDPLDPKIQATIEIEWERNLFPERYRPTQGDRVSAFGHWVYDCGHNGPFEIHPPVGVAVHRSRPILIPADRTFDEFAGPAGPQGVGTGVYVPGIISDIWFSNQGGRLMNCSVDTGLSNADFINGLPTCVPPPSLNRTFTFNIYLPRNPRMTMLEAGIPVPPVPLYVGTSNTAGFTARPPQIVQRTEGDVTWLEVTVDLIGFTADFYEGRIVAGWVLPAADNWGLAAWKLRLRNLNVTNNGEGTGPGTAPWRLWVNTNNARSVATDPSEWVKILDAPVAVGLLNFDGRPWETDAPTADRNLGPNLLKYPAPEIPAIPGPRDPGILFNSTGYQDDPVTDDDAGTVNRFFRPEPAAPSPTPNHCVPTSDAMGLVYSGCVEYTATIEIVPGPPLAAPVLTTGAHDIAGKYVLQCGSSQTVAPGVCAHVLAPPLESTATHPFEVALDPKSPSLPFTAVSSFSPDEREAGLAEGSIDELYQAVIKTRQTDPARVDRMLTNLRAILAENMAADPRKVSPFLAVLEVALPRDLWTQYFSDFAPPPPDPQGPVPSLTGDGVVAAAAYSVQIASLQLHCAPSRAADDLVLQWGGNRFELDLVMRATCGGSPASAGGPAASFDTHEGVGVGRFNGVPGAVIRWRFVDGRKSSLDSAAISVVAGSNALVRVLDATGPLTKGNLQAHDR